MKSLDYHLTIKEMPEEVRPRERLILVGPESLSNSELLAILLRTGTHKETAIDLAHKVLKQVGGLQNFAKTSVEQLNEIKGIGLAKGAQLKAAIELGKRIATSSEDNKVTIRSPQDVSFLVMEEMRHLDREHFRVVYLNTKNHVLGIETISVGSLNASIVHPRELFKKAILKSSAALILLHNHPSGDPKPSKEDIEVTKRMIEAGKILGIEILDHVIIGDNKYTSLKEQGLF